MACYFYQKSKLNKLQAFYKKSMHEKVQQKKKIIYFCIFVFQKLSESTPVIGVWDDHDYGNNNGGKVLK